MKQALLAGLFAIASAGGVGAADIGPADLSFDDYGGLEMSLTGTPGDPANGVKVLSSRGLGNCVACHQISALPDVAFQGNIGPALDGAGDRWSEAQLRGIVANAKVTFEGTMMPSFYKSSGFIRPGDDFNGTVGAEPLTPLLTAQQVEDAVAYLVTLK